MKVNNPKKTKKSDKNQNKSEPLSKNHDVDDADPSLDHSFATVAQTTLEQIRGIRGRLSLKLRLIADIILANPQLTREKNINELAQICAVSEATISRFVRNIGFSNYRSFQLRMAKEGNPADIWDSRSHSAQHIHEAISRHDSAKTIITKISQRSADVARTCSTTLDMNKMELAVKMICRAKILYFFAAGLSILAAENAMLRFSRIGKAVVFHREHNTQLFMANALHGRALAIGISHSGRTNHTLTALTLARQAGVATVAVTSFPDSPIARQCDVSLITPAGYASADEELLHESMISKFGQLVTIDVLYALVAVQNFDNSAKLIGKGDSLIRQSRWQA